MPSFQFRIAKVAQGNLRHIEALMREKKTLDFLSDTEFDQLAIDCAPLAKADPKRAEELARAMKLRTYVGV